MKRIRLAIVGQSGSGLLTVGDLVSRALKQKGFFLCADREYASLIKGGKSKYTINFSTEPVYALSSTVDVMVAIDKQSLIAYFPELKKGGVLIHGYERTTGIKDIIATAEEKKIRIISTPARELARSHGGNDLMVNMILTGMVWKVLGFELAEIATLVKEKFTKKPEIQKVALACVGAGYQASQAELKVPVPKKKEDTILLDGNHALALGAVHAGVRAYIAYPMSPSSSILTHMANMSEDLHLTIKQAEDEITAAQMTLGASFMGTRALTATSGGGYDLMTETVSLAGMIESPLVIVVAQRPGPATGLPTWTAQGDLNLAIHAGHGEFPRVVLACADPADAFELIQKAMNLAEEYQTPVIVLTEKVVAESKITVPRFKQGEIEIKRGLVPESSLETLKNSDRYKMTESGISPRWLPGTSSAYCFSNGDEHGADGRLTEESADCTAMQEKRMRKMETIKKNLPAPRIYGEEKGADISFIGWGSSKCVMRDVIATLATEGVKMNYLHYETVWPFVPAGAESFVHENKNIHLIEGNYEGQFGNVVEANSDIQFAGRLQKWDGRPFFVEEVIDYIHNHTK